MGDCVENVAKLMVNTSTTLPHPQIPFFIKKPQSGRFTRYDLSLVNPCWLFPVAYFSFMCPEISSKRTWFMFFPATEVRLDNLQLPGLSFECILNIGATFLWLAGVSMACQRWSEVALLWHQPALSASLDTALLVPWTCMSQVFSSNPWFIH